MASQLKKLAIFVSGSGTNMENLMKEQEAGRLPCEIVLVVCDKPGAAAIEKANRHGVEVLLVKLKDFPSKADYESKIIEELEKKKVDFIALAGYMKILTPEFVGRYYGRIVNIHPAYLPNFPGGHAIQDAFEAKVKETGVTIHFIDEGVDTGPIILQEKVPIHPDDTLESLEMRIHALEYQLYPKALNLALSGKVTAPVR